MKSEAEVRGLLKDLLSQEFDRRVSEAQLRLPRSCVHNHQQPLDVRKTVDGEPNSAYNRITQDRHHLPVVQTLGLCMLGASDPEEWPGDRICEEPIDAQRCPDFTSRLSKEEVLASFKAQVGDPQWLEAHLPKAAMLLWVLGQYQVPTSPPWWKRILFRFTPLKMEPQKPFELSTLLPEPHGSIRP